MNGESPNGSGIRVRLFGRTDVGQIREHNEDNFLVADLTRRSRSLMETDRVQAVAERGTVLGVCDGMGGAAAGEVASQLAVDIIYEKLSAGDPPRNHDDLARRLVNSVEEAGGRIFGEARADRTRRGMGTTATIAALLDSRLFVAQVGDSRAYVLRGDKFVQVSRDQSLVNQLIEAGQLTEEEAETFEHNNIILQALGTAETVQVDLTYVDLRLGDTLLVCSDGLSGMVRADEMREVLLSNREPFDACKELVDRANRAGGHDNITVIVAVFEGALSPPGPQDVLAYQKYALPEAPAEATVRAPSVHAPDVYTPPASQEAQRESRRLRVGHTMVGMTNPMASTPTSGTPTAPRVSNPPPTFSFEDDPVSIPTSGLPPSMVGTLVLVAMCLVAIAGFLLLR
ncbi:MAG TPA: Stp1/IreP family PP2C-type Ser/Thr phosphatase [Polyangiaceae bacterium]|nr:Stp1/IreP family PP2C-type Ser/Thr phosphatase [Polyangiaceae bacterium]